MKAMISGKFKGEAIIKDGKIKILLRPPFKFEEVEIISQENLTNQNSQQNCNKE